MARRDEWLDRFTFGGRLPGTVGVILVATVAASFLAAFTSRHVAPLFELAALRPELVLRGQIWRLVTWPFVEPSPLHLIFECLFLWWFGRDLADEWGSRRFFQVWFGVTLFASVVTSIVALVDPAVRVQSYLGGMGVAEALIVGWGLWFPDRVVRIYFVLPIKGLWLAWLTIAITIVFAVYEGWEFYLPTLAAEGGMLAWLFRRSFVGRWSSFQRQRRANAQQAQARTVAKKRAASAAHLRVIEGGDHDPPALSPELEGKIDALLRGAQKAGPKKE
ncbi:Rhomboid family protein [Labilithrix luteola]|uniref:Rhomboid family protein n=1 Tax=Labilithrix luteola TaxID=1391654 RepID=A0A0K1PLL3_9BACT|nr:rhomboid family intramembrane serine protease [Labilithrix luteola]AKU94412.1 Rhomboid family protein [Labilithrix luteola]